MICWHAELDAFNARCSCYASVLRPHLHGLEGLCKGEKPLVCGGLVLWQWLWALGEAQWREMKWLIGFSCGSCQRQEKPTFSCDLDDKSVNGVHTLCSVDKTHWHPLSFLGLGHGKLVKPAHKRAIEESLRIKGQKGYVCWARARRARRAQHPNECSGHLSQCFTPKHHTLL